MLRMKTLPMNPRPQAAPTLPLPRCAGEGGPLGRERVRPRGWAQFAAATQPGGLSHIATGALLLSLLFLAAGCGTARKPRVPEARPPVTVTPAPETTAQAAEATAEYVLAAREYQHLAAAAQPPARQNYQLKSVAALIKAGQVGQARDQLQAVDVGGLDPAFAARKHILGAHIALFERQPQRAVEFLNQAEHTPNLGPTQLAEIHWVRAQAHLALDDNVAAAESLLRRERVIVGQKEIAQNQQHLWDILESASRGTLLSGRAVARDPVLLGWIDLALLNTQYSADPARLRQAVDNWRRSYPNHPASATLLAALTSPASTAPSSFPLIPGLGGAPAALGRIDRIALLLPLSSQYATAAQAVRDGFLAIQAANSDPNKPRVQVYDIGADPAQVARYYRQAVSEGAQLVVGPLGLEATEQLARAGVFSTPTLLLSHVDKNQRLPTNVFQFGLPPEQEAVQAAERAYLDGRRHAVILYPDSEWGVRMESAFRAHWQSLGGVVLESQRYRPEETDFSGTVKKLLNIDASEARRVALEARVKTRLEFDPRRRQDVDCIFLAAYPQPGRLIKPQINFYRGLDLPVYATSHIFAGKADPANDADLNGVVYGDMPWILVDDGKIRTLKDTIQRDWPHARTQFDRLYALGVDAYRVIPQLNRLGSDQYLRFGGVTSGLSMDSAGRFHRQLVWARFEKGVPVLIDKFLNYKGQYELDGETDRPYVAEPGKPG